MTRRGIQYPFSAIVGQEEMKEALLFNVIMPSIGGVLIRGEKGTAKSTAVRALADLLPDREVVEGCPFRCEWGDPDNYCSLCQEKISSGEKLEKTRVHMRVVELPLSATEDRVAGTLDIEQAITTGTRKFQPGILAEANGNILYVDEVNLLDDHLVDMLLDAAAMGINYVEREGISIAHPAKFLLVGTMNPEEGDLRPQLQDRFGLVVDVRSESEIDLRKKIIRRRLEFDRDPLAFVSLYEDLQHEMNQKIVHAKQDIEKIEVDDTILEKTARLTLHLGVDGHRADLTLIRASIAAAALAGREKISREDIFKAAQLSLPHRIYRRPFEMQEYDQNEIISWISEQFPDVPA